MQLRGAAAMLGCATLVAAGAPSVHAATATAEPGFKIGSPLAAPDPKAPFYAQLPEAVRQAGVLRFVGDAHPPYRIVSDDRRIADGLEPALARALERQLGVPIRHHVVNSLSATLAGIEAGRYDVALGPGVATLERQKRFDGVAWMRTRPAFVYPNDRTPRYASPLDLCGKRISYVAGSVTERVTERVVAQCAAAGRPPALHVPLVDNNMTLVATQAGRADVAGMTLTSALHAVHVNGARFGMYSDESGSLGGERVSLFVSKRSGLGPVLRDAMQAVMDSGEYLRLMKAWGVGGVAIDAAALNVAK